MVGLVLLGVILTPKTIGILDQFKDNEEKHNEQINGLANQIKYEDNILQEKNSICNKTLHRL